MFTLSQENPMPIPFANPPFHADAAWKYVLGEYFPDFLNFFYPHIANHIDWLTPYETLDKELLSLTSESMVGKRLVDKLFKVRLKQGGECFLLLHIEVQGDYETHLAQRLFEYFYRLYDRYRLPIITMAILTDDSPSWQPDRYQMSECGLEILNFQFFPKKLLDYQSQETKLLEMDNPFGTVVATLSCFSNTPKSQCAL